MSDIQRELIGSVARGKTKKGEIVAHLFSTDTRLEFPALVLFDLSMLEQVGIDPNTLDTDPVYRRFWAYYTLSEKTTSKGNPYKDVQYLEPLDAAATTTSVDTSAILAELRHIRRAVEALAVTLGMAPIQPEDWAERAEAEQIAALPDNGHDNGDEPEAPEDLPTFENILPTSAQAMLEWAQGQNVPAQSIGHLLYAMRKEIHPDWNWPVHDDIPAWEEACEAWLDYNDLKL